MSPNVEMLETDRKPRRFRRRGSKSVHAPLTRQPTFIPLASSLANPWRRRDRLSPKPAAPLTVTIPADERRFYPPGEGLRRADRPGVYRKASRTILGLLIGKLDLLGSLRSVKHFFVVDQGEFLLQFMDMAEEELSQNIDEIVSTHLKVLVQPALSASLARHDRYKNCVKHQILERRLVSQAKNQNAALESISGHEALPLNRYVDWPLNLVLSAASLGGYQMVCRFLFYCTHVESMFPKTWGLDKSAKLKTTACPKVAFGLRKEIMAFVEDLHEYITVGVLDTSSIFFQDRLQEVQKADEVLPFNPELTDSFVNLCRVTNFPVFQPFYQIFQQGLEFVIIVMSDDVDAKFGERVKHYQRTAHIDLTTQGASGKRGGTAPHGQESSLTEIPNRIDLTDSTRIC
ncbi:gamma-tubulin complex component 2-like [Haemaphysalis longicornis]